ncbi:FAD-binding oxidoreductase [uncultured Tateyamaria sp.]|uniref:NAD(P)/FAD-dependent oxidoreductase n=1 Tax=uncultured Tateyamaria sp. TaxID=455651 RepID=UPI0026316591|nr:FAD-binding oxidoreductase [uncultured Tateyamaria sp.]
MPAKEHIIVVGAGIVGVSAAIWLLRAGKKVTLLDRSEPGEGTSYGNAGVLASCSVAPVTAPGMIAKAPKMLLDPEFPLFLRWSYLPKLAPWLLKYLSHANAPETRRIAQGLAPLTSDSVEQHESLTNGTDASRWLTRSDYSFAYRDRAAFEADAFTWGLRRDAGFEPDIIEGPAVQEFEPLLSTEMKLLAVMRQHGVIDAPGSYVKALAQEAEALGARLVQSEVRDILLKDDRVEAVVIDGETIPCDGVVIATGVWSKPLAAKLGINVPLETERGYHIEFEPEDDALRAPIMVTTGKFVATPMSGGLRCAGVVEFGGLKAPASDKPIALLERTVRATFPNLKLKKRDTWLGHRPAPSDSLPLIGEIGASGVFAAFGHHHIGLTGGPKTGRIIADLISHGGVNMDLAPYDPNRFGG